MTWLPSDLWKQIARLGGVETRYKMCQISHEFRDMILPLESSPIRMGQLYPAPNVSLCEVNLDRLQTMREVGGATLTSVNCDFQIGSYSRFLHSLSGEYRRYYALRKITISRYDDTIYCITLSMEPMCLLTDYFVTCLDHKDNTFRDYYVLVMTINKCTESTLDYMDIQEALLARLIGIQNQVIKYELKWVASRSELHILMPLS
jgi:hypothetical protein